MNQSPSRHPLFVAIAGIALAGAWSTGAYEAETGTSVALLGQDMASSAPRDAELECSGPRGPARALCLFRHTAAAGRYDTPMESVALPEPSTPPRAVRVAARRSATRSELR
jgi:hypothetical protein